MILPSTFVEKCQQKMRAYARKHDMLLGKESVLIAVSGGADSMALLEMVARLAPLLKLQIGIAHLDHELRGEESRKDATFVNEQARERGLKIFIGRADRVAQVLFHPTHDFGGGVQRVDDAWVELLQCRQKFLANAVAKESGVLVGFILAPLNSGLLHELPNLAASGPKQRAGKDQPAPQRTNRGNPGKPRNAASAKQVYQQCFGVVVGSVAG